jgi:phytoene dehydrogenase-like protein
MSTRPAQDHFDCLVIGGGHNGLVAAAYLGRAGKRVAVIERRGVLGGCACTESPWPGYRVSTAAYVISLFPPQIIDELGLREHGLRILPRDPSSFTPTDAGRGLLMGPNLAATCEEIAQFSRPDADAYPRYNAMLESISEVLEPLLQRPAPNPFPDGTLGRRLSWSDQWRNARGLWQLRGSLNQLRDRIPETLDLLTGAARPLLERWFESEPLRATLATDAIIGAFAPPSALGTAYVLLHHVMGEAGGARGVWGYVRGGMGGLAEALEQACLRYNVTIYKELAVARIATRHDRVEKIVTADGRELFAPIVLSSIDAQTTMLRLLENSDRLLPDGLRSRLSAIDYSSASLKINLALGEPPQFTCRPSQGLAPWHRGTMHVAPELDYIERAYDDAKYGRPSREPVLEMTLPSAVDDSVAPAGKYLMNIFVQYAPYHLREGNWDQTRESFAKRCLDTIARYAPNLPSAVEQLEVLTPQDLESRFGLTGGNIFQGSMIPTQLYWSRPLPGWCDYRTPVPGLWLCGAAAHPGGGVTGIPGRNAAHAVLASR